MERVDIPNLRSEPGLVEWGYLTDTGRLARVRFVTTHLAADRVGAVNVPVAPMAVSKRVSVSFVDEEGQVLAVAGLALVSPEESHSWQFGGGSFDPAAWMDERARDIATRWEPWAATLIADASLVEPPADEPIGAPTPAPTPTPADPRRLSVRQYLALLGPAILVPVLSDDDAITRIIVANTLGAEFIHLDDPDVANGLAHCVAREHCTAVDRDRVLAGLPPS